MAKLTGERPMEGATPDSLLALHDAGYREVVGAPRARASCSTSAAVSATRPRSSAAPDRLVIGADYSARDRRSTTGRTRTRSRDCASRAWTVPRSACATAPSTHVVSSHIIEHFVNPVLHVAELARVLRAGGTGVRDHAERARRLREPVPRLPVRARAARLDAAAVLRRGRVPRARRRRRAPGRLRGPARERRAHPARSTCSGSGTTSPAGPTCGRTSRCCRSSTGCSGASTSGIGSGIDESHLFMTSDILPTTPVLFAIARGPRIPVRARG